MTEKTTLCPNVKTGVLLLHGLTGMPSEMRPVAKYLTQMGCKVSSPMLAGHGGDHWKLLAVTWQDWVAGAKEALTELAKECDHVIVGGLSMGALISLLLAVDEPKVSGIILMSTTLKYDGRNTSRKQIFLPFVDIFPSWAHWFYWTEEPPYGLKDERLQKQITKQIEAAARGESNEFGLFRTYAGSLRQLMKMVKVVKKQAKRVRCPALIVHSLEDSMTTLKNVEDLCSVMTSNEKTVVLLGGCDHVLTLDLRRKEVSKQIGKFVIKTSWENQPQRQQLYSTPRF